MFDLHNHMLPGLDDGADDWRQSLAMARLAAEDGIRGVVCTPHWIAGYFENTREKVLETVSALRERLAREQIPLEIYPGAELRVDPQLLRGIETGELLTPNDTGKFALVELSEGLIPAQMENLLWDFQVQGITPILSHPERNRGVIRDPVRMYRWLEMGALAQITAASVLGRFGPEIRRFSLFLLEHNMAHILATDAHGDQVRAPRLQQGWSEVEKVFGKEAARRMVLDTPGNIIRGDPVVPGEMIPLGKRAGGGLSITRRIFSFLGFKSAGGRF